MPIAATSAEEAAEAIADTKHAIACARAKEQEYQKRADNATKGVSDADAAFNTAKDEQQKVGELKEKSDKLKKLKDILNGLNTALNVAQVAFAVATTAVSVASAAVAAATASNWIPFWDCGPSEIATGVAVAEGVSAAAEETAASGTLAVAKTAAEGGEEAYEAAVAEEASLAEDGFEGTAEAVAKAETKVTQAESTLKSANDVKNAAMDALQKAKDVTKATLTAYDTALKTFPESLLEPLIESNADWNVLRGLDNIMQKYPPEGKYDPNDEDSDSDGDECECDEDGGPDPLAGLVEGVTYTIFTVISGLADKFGDEDTSPKAWTMYGMTEAEYLVCQEISVICEAYGLPVPDSLSLPDIQAESTDDKSKKQSDDSRPHPIILVKGFLPLKPIDWGKGFSLVTGVINLGDKSIYNAKGTAKDKRFGSWSASSWINWWKKGRALVKKPILKSTSECGCRIAIPGKHTSPKKQAFLVGGHMDVDDYITAPKNMYAMLPICKFHNKKIIFDRDTGTTMKCRPVAVGILFPKDAAIVY